MLPRNNRLLIVDDNEAIHEDFRKILCAPATDPGLLSAEAILFDHQPAATADFVLTSAFQGEEGVTLARDAVAAEKPFAMAFVDIRMPPGIDGIETARRLWEADPDLPIVICSAYSDYAWPEMAAQLGDPARWVLLKKPFENVEVLQLAAALAQKRALGQIASARQIDLENRVAERTEKLTAALTQLEAETAERLRTEESRRAFERKMEQAQRLESLGVLAGGIAHDFNNLLTGVLGRASLARLDVRAGSEIDSHLREIEVCARRAAELCEQMLAYAGQGSVASRELDVNALVREIGGLVHASVPRDAEFRVELAPAPLMLRGDPARLRQVVMNLVINGAEALDHEPRRLALTTRACPLDADAIARTTVPGDAVAGRFIAIEVADTGIGMAPETQRRIFEPFFTTKFEGRGLGLCAVLGIVRSHGGALDVESAPGRGSRFRVYLPALPSAVPIPASAAAPPTRGPAPATGPLARLLVVDDEEAVRHVTAETLRRHNFQVVVATDGVDALEVFQKQPQPIDAVVLDLTMPRMNGVAALAALRELRPHLPAVLISGYGQEHMMERLADRELTVALHKPYEIEDLVQAVLGVLAAAAKRGPKP